MGGLAKGRKSGLDFDEVLGCLGGSSGESFTAAILNGDRNLAIARCRLRLTEAEKAAFIDEALETAMGTDRTGSARTAETIEKEVSWGPFDNDIISQVRDGNPKAATLALLRRHGHEMTVEEAEIFIHHVVDRTANRPVDLIEIRPADVVTRVQPAIHNGAETAAREGETCIFRYRDKVFAAVAWSNDDGSATIYHDRERLRLVDIDQVWRLVHREATAAHRRRG